LFACPTFDSAMGRSSMYTDYNLTEVQLRVKGQNEAGDHGKAPKNCVVTGGTGFVGQRLVEMLVERGAERVVSFDVVAPSAGVLQHKAIEYVIGDLTDPEAVSNAIKGADVVWHIAAAVGPYHPHDLYKRVNVGGTQNVIDAMKRHGVKKLIYSSSPSTRFSADYRHIDGLTEDELPQLPQKAYVAEYAKTKADGELLMRQAVAADKEFLALACAPHQVYGPRDNLFLPNVLESCGSGKLRIFGSGENRVCMTYVDNYCHGLIISEKKLYPGSPALSKFYICTDGDTHSYKEGYVIFWDEIDKIAVGVGFPSIKDKFHLPKWLMLFIGWICTLVGNMIGKVLKLNVFSVHMMTMHRWFKIDAAENDLGYKPLVTYEEGRADTIQWFRTNWLPTYKQGTGGFTGSVAAQTTRKIDIQSASEQKTR